MHYCGSRRACTTWKDRENPIVEPHVLVQDQKIHIKFPSSKESDLQRVEILNEFSDLLVSDLKNSLSRGKYQIINKKCVYSFVHSSSSIQA